MNQRLTVPDSGVCFLPPSGAGSPRKDGNPSTGVRASLAGWRDNCRAYYARSIRRFDESVESFRVEWLESLFSACLETARMPLCRGNSGGI